jgi:hypothetical protein
MIGSVAFVSLGGAEPPRKRQTGELARNGPVGLAAAEPSARRRAPPAGAPQVPVLGRRFAHGGAGGEDGYAVGGNRDLSKKVPSWGPGANQLPTALTGTI